MNLHRFFRIFFGLTLWVAVSAWGVVLVTEERGGAGSVFDELEAYFLRREVRLQVRFPRRVFLAVGDAVRLDGEDGRQVGEISELLDDEGRPRPERFEWVRAVRIRLHDRESAGIRRDARVRLVRDTGSFVSALNILIPPEKKGVVGEEWRKAWRRYRAEIIEHLTPVGLGYLDDIRATAAAELRPFIARHRGEIDALLDRAEGQLDADELTRLFEEEVWPIVRRHLKPVTDDIGSEVWERLPLWGLSWRLAYGSLPLTRDDYFERRWSEFVREEVRPILKSHAKDFFKASREIARETLAERRVTSTVRDVAYRIAGDPEFHRLADVYVREVFVENPRFQLLVKRRWESQEVREALDFVSERIEVTVRGIGDILLGTRKSGITPEFAKLLRAQIFRKGIRWLVVDRGSAEEPLLEDGAWVGAEVSDGH